jgi:hypothetical protein
LARYLLGQLPEGEQQRIEESFFSDEEFLAELLVVEDDLIDDYVRGQLSASERERFEKFFLASPRRQQRVAFATTVAGHFSAPEAVTAEPAAAEQEPASRWQSLRAFFSSRVAVPKLLLASVAIVMLFGGAWLVVDKVWLSSRLGTMPVEQTAAQQREQELERRGRLLQENYDRERARNEELTRELERRNSEVARLERELEEKQRELPGVVSFRLTPYLVRDIDRPKRLIVPSGADFVRLRLSFSAESDYRSYRAAVRAVVRGVGGGEVYSEGELRGRKTSAGRTVTLILPAAVLNRADYILTLTGVSNSGNVEDVADFYFSILRY